MVPNHPGEPMVLAAVHGHLALIGNWIVRFASAVALTLYVNSRIYLHSAVSQTITQDDGTPMMSCGSCSKWQHISCHDRADQAAGRSKRNWDDVEFFCYKCRVAKSHGQPDKSNGNVTSQPIQLSAPYRTNGGYVPKASSTAVPAYQVPYSVPNHYAQHTQAPLTFSHYQPEQRVFMPSQMHQPYGSSLTHQPYGGTMNGHPSSVSNHECPYMTTPLINDVSE